jgi:hypothetical protein
MPRIPRSEIRALKAAYAKGGPFASALDFAMAVLNDPDAPLEAKLRLARAVLPFQTPKLEAACTGKKEAAAERAEDAARGAFAPPPVPKQPN